MSTDNGSVDDLTFDTQLDDSMLSINRQQVDLIDLGIDYQDGDIEHIVIEPPVESMHELGTSTNPRSRPLATRTYMYEHGLSKSGPATDNNERQCHNMYITMFCHC